MSGVTVPPRKRRRAALSCLECRRRKIKCDRRTPCTHCMLLKSITCVYPDIHAHITNRRSVPKASSAAILVNNQPESAGVTGRISLDSGAQCPHCGPSIRGLLRLANGATSVRGSSGLPPVFSTDDTTSGINAQSVVNQAGKLSKASLSKHTDEVLSVLGVNFSSYGDVILQVGGNHKVLTTNVSKQSIPTAVQDEKLSSDKAQHFGRSHWMNTFNMFSRRCRFEDEGGNLVTGVESHEVRKILEECKTIMRALKVKRPVRFDLNPKFNNNMPPREIADDLVNLYFRTCESAYRILHIPSFKKEYANHWNEPEGRSTALTVKILLVMAIGTCFYQGDGEEKLRSQAEQWVSSAQSWAAGPFGKDQLSISWIQIHCLLLLVRQTNALGTDLVWVQSGNLLRLAFSMGFHRDPKYFPKLSVFVAEMRRRIWATVLEMTVQTSMDVGMPPLLTSHDFDTEPPSNIDDEDIIESTTITPKPKPNHVYTRTSIQNILLKSLYTRLEIVQFINSFHVKPSYDEVLRFSHAITKACNEASRLIQSYSIYLPRPTAFQINLLDILVRRFLLEVHRPFFLESQTDPHYHFSRRVCLDTALVIFFYSGVEDLPLPRGPQAVDDYERLKMIGEGLNKPILFLAITIIAVELMHQLEEDISSGLPLSLQATSSRAPLYQAINNMTQLETDRIRLGENNAVGLVFFSAAAALIHAMTHGQPPAKLVPEAAKRAAEHCLEILRTRPKLAPQELDLESQPPRHVNMRSRNTSDSGLGVDFLIPDMSMDSGMQEGDFGLDTLDLWAFTDWNAN